MMYVVPLSCQALCLAFWLLNVPFQATANSLKNNNPKTAKKTKKTTTTKHKKKNKLTDTQSNPVEQKVVKMLFATEPNISLRSR